jgi:hypothetical protein
MRLHSAGSLFGWRHRSDQRSGDFRSWNTRGEHRTPNLSNRDSSLGSSGVRVSRAVGADNVNARHLQLR